MFHYEKNNKRSNIKTLSSYGWYTPTTKERLNGILDMLDMNYRIKQEKGVWYFVPKYGNTSFKKIKFRDGVVLDINNKKHPPLF